MPFVRPAKTFACGALQSGEKEGTGKDRVGASVEHALKLPNEHVLALHF